MEASHANENINEPRTESSSAKSAWPTLVAICTAPIRPLSNFTQKSSTAKETLKHVEGSNIREGKVGLSSGRRVPNGRIACFPRVHGDKQPVSKWNQCPRRHNRNKSQRHRRTIRVDEPHLPGDEVFASVTRNEFPQNDVKEPYDPFNPSYKRCKSPWPSNTKKPDSKRNTASSKGNKKSATLSP